MRHLGIGLLFFLFLEIMSIVWVADWLGGLATLGLMILIFMIGVAMLRHIGLSSVLLAGSTLRSGENISLYQMLWPFRYTVAALLFMSPGFISLIIALILMLPIKGKSLPSMNDSQFQNHPFGAHHRRRASQYDDDDIIEGECSITPNDKQNSTLKNNHIEHRQD